MAGEKDQFEVPYDFDSPEDDFDSPDEAEPEIIITGPGYRIMPHPLTGKPTRFPRASSFGGGLSDEYTLTEWKIALAVLGVAIREDLTALAQSQPRHLGPIEHREKGWWMPWAEIGHKGMNAAESMSGAHKGTSIHSWGEQLDTGAITLDEVPEKWRKHLAHYQRVRAEAGLRILPEYVETIVLTLKLHNGVCGRLDGLRGGEGGWLVVDDTKTGKNAPEGMDEIAIQLAIYANAEWHWQGGETPNHGWVPAPANVRSDVATITWVPIDRPEESEVIPVDVAWGWQAAKVAAWVKAYQNRSRRKNNGLRLSMAALTDVFPHPDSLCVGCGYPKDIGQHGYGGCV